MPVTDAAGPPWPTARALITPCDQTAQDLLARYPDGVRPGDVIYSPGDVVHIAGADRTVARDAVVPPDGVLRVEFLPPTTPSSVSVLPGMNTLIYEAIDRIPLAAAVTFRPYGCVDLTAPGSTPPGPWRANRYAGLFAEGSWTVLNQEGT